jgi:hypothetical protein
MWLQQALQFAETMLWWHSKQTEAKESERCSENAFQKVYLGINTLAV